MVGTRGLSLGVLINLYSIDFFGQGKYTDLFFNTGITISISLKHHVALQPLELGKSLNFGVEKTFLFLSFHLNIT